MPLPVAAWIAALTAELEDIEPKHEGLRDWARLNLKPETGAEVRALIDDYDRCVGLLTALRAALEALVAAGYPILRVREISPEALADLEANKRTIEAAFTQFVAAATTLGLAAGAIEAKG